MSHRLILAAASLCLLSACATAEPEAVVQPAPPQAAVQQPATTCPQTDEVMAQAEERYGEFPVSMALSQRGYTVVTLANRQSGTWTIIARRPISACAM